MLNLRRQQQQIQQIVPKFSTKLGGVTSLQIKKKIRQQKNQHLYMQILRIRAREKQQQTNHIWKYNDDQLERFFIKYQLYQGFNLKINQLINSKTIKLVKYQNKIYFGEIDTKKKNGVGICIYKEGKLYEGKFKDNQKWGLGYQIYPNGNVYIGHYQKNKKHGLGTFYWFNNVNSTTEGIIQYYQGQWWGGLPSGAGFYRRSNGDCYEGDFRNGLKHGEGNQQFFNGDRYKGNYVNGLPEGFGEYYWKDGSIFKGQFKQGIRNGFGVWKKNNKPNSQLYKGHYLFDRKSGYGVYQWETGQYYKGQFFKDLRHGYGELYNKQNLIYQGMWIQGKQLPNYPIKMNQINNFFNQQEKYQKYQKYQPSPKNQSLDNTYTINNRYLSPSTIPTGIKQPMTSMTSRTNRSNKNIIKIRNINKNNKSINVKKKSKSPQNKDEKITKKNINIGRQKLNPEINKIQIKQLRGGPNKSIPMGKSKMYSTILYNKNNISKNFY